MKCYQNELKNDMTLVDCETAGSISQNNFKGSKFCLKTALWPDSQRSCMNNVTFMEQKQIYPNLKEADGCYPHELTDKRYILCVCSKDECNTAIKTSYSNILALAPIITIIKAVLLGIF